MYNTHQGDKLIFKGKTFDELKDLISKNTNKLIKIEEEYYLLLMNSTAIYNGNKVCKVLSYFAAQNNLTLLLHYRTHGYSLPNSLAYSANMVLTLNNNQLTITKCRLQIEQKEYKNIISLIRRYKIQTLNCI